MSYQTKRKDARSSSEMGGYIGNVNRNNFSERILVVSLPESSSLKTLVNALDSLGATPDDIMSILQALHEAGALDADLEVI